MRVCIVTVAVRGVGGLQDHGRALARGLSAAGHEVHVLAAGRPDGPDPGDGAQWHWLDVPTSHPRLPRRHPDWLRFSYESFMHLQRQVGFDVVHSESTSALALMCNGVHHTVPVVLKLHGNYLGEIRQALRRIRRGTWRDRARDARKIAWHTGMHLQHGEYRRFRPCEWMVTSQHEYRDAWMESFLVPARGHIVPNGIDTSVFRPQDRATLKHELGVGDATLLVCAGRLDPLKGTSVAVRALAQLRAAAAPVRLAVLGDGPDLESLRALTAELRLDDAVTFVPPQPHPELARWLAAADAFLFPTRLNEAAPLVPLQAMACGTPVVASDVGTLREMIGQNGDAGGLFVPAGSPDALADAVGRISANDGLRGELATRALDRVQRRYTLERMIEQTVEVYEAARARHVRR
jgi:glycosyltransferase involved in cell wall biosynthesis